MALRSIIHTTNAWQTCQPPIPKASRNPDTMNRTPLLTKHFAGVSKAYCASDLKHTHTQGPECRSRSGPGTHKIRCDSRCRGAESYVAPRRCRPTAWHRVRTVAIGTAQQSPSISSRRSSAGALATNFPLRLSARISAPTGDSQGHLPAPPSHMPPATREHTCDPPPKARNPLAPGHASARPKGWRRSGEPPHPVLGAPTWPPGLSTTATATALTRAYSKHNPHTHLLSSSRPAWHHLAPNRSPQMGAARRAGRGALGKLQRRHRRQAPSCRGRGRDRSRRRRLRVGGPARPLTRDPIASGGAWDNWLR